MIQYPFLVNFLVYWLNYHVMQIATAKALLSNWNDDRNLSREQRLKVFQCEISLKFQLLYTSVCKEYVECFKDMHGRSPGEQCLKALPYLKSGV